MATLSLPMVGLERIGRRPFHRDGRQAGGLDSGAVDMWPGALPRINRRGEKETNRDVRPETERRPHAPWSLALRPTEPPRSTGSRSRPRTRS